MSATIKARHYPDMPPALDGETDDQYTNRLTGADGTGRSPYDHTRNRQCSIGWHTECSDPAGATCECPCHPIRVALEADGYSDPLPMPGSLWNDNTADYLPAGHVRRVWISSTSKTTSGWQCSVIAWLLDANGRPDSEDGTNGVLHVDRLLAGYECVQAAR